MQHFKTLSDYLRYLELPRPEHPQLSVHLAEGEDHLPCPKLSSPPITNDCYTISFKKIVDGELTYGRTKYDFTNGALFFIAPRQVLQWESELIMEQQGFSISFHEDFIKGTPIAQEINSFGFFSYTANEALHLSPKEEEQMIALVRSIEAEYQNNQDVFSQEIIVAHLSTLLKYAQRFYERQFINRKPWSNDLLSLFNSQLRSYAESGMLQTEGIPTIEHLATKLAVSQRYLSDTLKKETGKTTTEHLQLFLIDQSKELLLNPTKSVAEVAYELGFEYPPYFSRLFKKKEGISPTAYRSRYSIN